MTYRRRLVLWTLPLWLVPPACIALGAYLESDNPPCESFIDGPCQSSGSLLGVDFWLVLLGIPALAFEVLVLACLAVVWYVRRP